MYGKRRILDTNLKPTGKYYTAVKKLKTPNSKRNLALNDLLFEKLKRHIAENPSSDEFVFHTVTGLLHTSKSLYKKLQQILKKLGLPSVGSHEMRRICCTNLVLKKVPPKVTQFIVGHSDITTTNRFYVIVEEEQANEALDETDDSIFAELEEYNNKVQTQENS